MERTSLPHSQIKFIWARLSLSVDVLSQFQIRTLWFQGPWEMYVGSVSPTLQSAEVVIAVDPWFARSVTNPRGTLELPSGERGSTIPWCLGAFANCKG